MENNLKTKTPKVQVWSCGGGSQSCAIAVLIIQGKLPKPDISVIADTGRETRATWEYYDAYLKPGLASVGVDLIRIKSEDWSYHGIKVSYSNKTVAMPVFSTMTGPIEKTKNFCTRNWKIDVMKRWMSEVNHLTRSKFCMWIGFSRDEINRVWKCRLGKDFKRGLVSLPLVDIFPTTRRQAIELVQNHGWPTPPRSACWMCPNHSDNEWRLIRDTRPDEFQKAIELEREIHKVDPDAWLHRSCVPLDQVDFSQPDDLFSRPCDSGVCFV